MPKYSSADVGFFLVGGYNLLADTTVLGVSKSAETKESTVLGDTWRTHVATGLKNGEFSQDGFFDDRVDGIHDRLKSYSGDEKVGMIALEGNAVGDAMIGFEGLVQVAYERRTSLGELVGAKAGYKVSGSVEEGVVLAPLATRADDGDTISNSIDLGASSADGGVLWTNVTALDLDGGDSLNIRLIDSDDDITFAVVTFTAFTTRLGQKDVFAGALERYVACQWEYVGSEGAAATSTFAVGLTVN